MRLMFILTLFAFAFASPVHATDYVQIICDKYPERCENTYYPPPDQTQPETHSETEVAVSCNPIGAMHVARLTAKNKLEGWGYTVTACEHIAPFKGYFNGVPVFAHIYETHDCPKEYSINPGLSNIGMEYTAVERCHGQR